MGASRGCGQAAVVIASSLVVMGGGCQGTIFDSAEAYDSTADAWTDVAPMSTARYHTAAVAVV